MFRTKNATFLCYNRCAPSLLTSFTRPPSSGVLARAHGGTSGLCGRPMRRGQAASQRARAALFARTKSENCLTEFLHVAAEPILFLGVLVLGPTRLVLLVFLGAELKVFRLRAGRRSNQLVQQQRDSAGPPWPKLPQKLVLVIRSSRLNSYQSKELTSSHIRPATTRHASICSQSRSN